MIRPKILDHNGPRGFYIERATLHTSQVEAERAIRPHRHKRGARTQVLHRTVKASSLVLSVFVAVVWLKGER